MQLVQEPHCRQQPAPEPQLPGTCEPQPADAANTSMQPAPALAPAWSAPQPRPGAPVPTQRLVKPALPAWAQAAVAAQPIVRPQPRVVTQQQHLQPALATVQQADAQLASCAHSDMVEGTPGAAYGASASVPDPYLSPRSVTARPKSQHGVIGRPSPTSSSRLSRGASVPSHKKR